MTQRSLTLSLAAVVVVIGLGALGCGGGGGGGVEQATVTGTVRDDADLQPVGNAQVAAGGDTATTNAAGAFTLQTTAGAKTIQITRNGYQQLSLNRTLQAGNNAIGTQYFRPALQAGNGAATGTVRRDGVPLAGALVHGDSHATTKTDGTFAIYNLEAGERGLLGLDPLTDRVGFTAVNITAGQTTAGADIELDLEPPLQPDF